ncbi:transcription factor kayak-like isoform X2 [Daphnia pulicaria]|nr:transcription factor kayak-like isoform X2 [Daphnia pulicaria]
MYSAPHENHDATRLTVADILSTMANSVDAMTPTTLSLLDGLTGVPTRTTPTLTPTTLRSIEQTFLDMAANQMSHDREAGFVPPMVPSNSFSSTASNYTVTVTTSTEQDVKPQWPGASSVPNNNNSDSPPAGPRNTGRRMSVGSNSSSSNSGYSSTAMSFTSGSARRGGGRRKEDRDRDEPGEDSGKRLMRRERNKQAAARCRKRRLDHTMALQQETELWEDKKQILQNEIRQLQKHKEELEQLLDSHRPQCKMMRKTGHYPSNNKAPLLPAMPNLMPIPNVQQPQQQQQQQQQQQHSHVQQQPIKEERHESDESSSDGVGLIEFTRPTIAPRPRPTTLPVASPFTNAPPRNSSWHEIAGIAITTPSSGIPGFNFDSLMEGGTGLTPVVPSPSCGTQQQRSNAGSNGTTLPVDLSSPEAVNRKLVSL